MPIEILGYSSVICTYVGLLTSKSFLFPHVNGTSGWTDPWNNYPEVALRQEGFNESRIKVVGDIIVLLSICE